MIAWKCWHDNRRFVIAGLAWILLFWVVLLSHGPAVERGPRFTSLGPDLLSGLLQEFLNLQIVIFALLAWGMGTRSVGRDAGNGAGSFILTRPVRRGSYVWAEWFVGVGLLAVLLSCSGLCYWAAVHFHMLRLLYVQLGPENHLLWVNTTVTLGTVAIASFSAYLFLVLIFSLTHCGTVIFRHSTWGLLFCLAVIGGYLFLVWEIYLHHDSWSPHIPDLLFQPFYSFPRNVDLVPHAVSSFVERAAFLPLIPLIAQLFLRRAEV